MWSLKDMKTAPKVHKKKPCLVFDVEVPAESLLVHALEGAASSADPALVRLEGHAGWQIGRLQKNNGKMDEKYCIFGQWARNDAI